MSRIPSNENADAANSNEAGDRQEDWQTTGFGNQQAPTAGSFDTATGDDAVSDPVIVNR